MKSFLTVVGARPQFVKAAPLSRALRKRHRETLVHTGQHYDEELSGAFFKELDLPAPEVNLGVGSGSHAAQVRAMSAGLARILAGRAVDGVIVFGDTNSTLAAALAAFRAGIPCAHVEAGLRSGNRTMPEETNRIVADHLADLCLCPTAGAAERLRAEGCRGRVVLAGDVMLDACLEGRARAGRRGPAELGLEPGGYAWCTFHRAENTDRPSRLAGIVEALGRLEGPVVMAVHPRTRAALGALGTDLPANVTALPPVSYLTSLSLLDHARVLLTDSGGLQKEAWFLGTRCVTLRDETEWPETLAGGWNVLAGADPSAIVAAVNADGPPAGQRDLERFGGGRAAAAIVDALETL